MPLSSRYRLLTSRYRLWPAAGSRPPGPVPTRLPLSTQRAGHRWSTAPTVRTTGQRRWLHVMTQAFGCWVHQHPARSWRGLSGPAQAAPAWPRWSRPASRAPGARAAQAVPRDRAG